ncbi:hypothetical protein D3C72_1441790 [compost metagenome]
MAFSDEHQNIAGLDGTLDTFLDNGFVSDHIGDARGDTAGNDGGRRTFPQRIEGGSPILFVFSGFRRHHVPHFHSARMTGPVGSVFHRFVIGAETAGVIRV